MNWEALGAIAELLGAIGVIATLGYLATQIRQNSKLLQLNNTYQTLDASRTNFLAYLAQVDVAALISKVKSKEDLSHIENEAYFFYFLSQIRNWENAFLQHQGGGLNDEVLDAIKIKVSSLLEDDSARSAWRATKPQAVESFRAWVDKIVEEDV